MSGKVLKFLNGFPGTTSRAVDEVIEAFPNGEETAHIAFGAPVALDGNKVVNVTAEKTDVIGIAVRGVKTENTYGEDDADYLPNEMVDVMKRGTIVVQMPEAQEGETVTDPTSGGKVYIVKATGAFAAEADSDNTLEMAHWKFKGAPDANRVVEISLNERVY